MGDVYLILDTDNTIQFEVMSRFNLERVHEILNGFMEIVRLDGHVVMLVDDCGLINNKKVNSIASSLYGYPIMGTAILCAEEIIDGEPDLTGFEAEILTKILRYVFKG